jgi:Ca2+/H+ antiporter
VRAVLIAAALIAVVSTGAPLSVAQDTATGVLLATIHLVTGAAFLVTAWRVVPPVS